MDRKKYGEAGITTCTCNRFKDILEIWEAVMGVAIVGDGSFWMYVIKKLHCPWSYQICRTAWFKIKR